jgi:hypothetical protein
MGHETDQEARRRQWEHATRGFEEAQQQERQERVAAARRRDATWANMCLEHPELRRLPMASTSTRSATVTRGSAPWAVRVMHNDGRAEWHKADGSESGARDLAARLRKTSQGKVEVLRMGGGRTDRGTTR